ncbi:MAG: hypothetical protein JXX28_04470 [Deltaproteobacteria bacterium]|nr:hypothetical protein [Deltaproteobacteria bacterium]
MSFEDDEPLKVLFVCSGNICRSPMAEGLASHYAGIRARDIEFRSAGTLLLQGRPADRKACAVCQELSVSIWDHRSQGVSQELVDWADHILVMEYHHSEYIRSHHQAVGDKLKMLGAFGGLGEIPDPTGFWKFRYRRTRDDLRRCVESFIDRLPRREDEG